MIFTIQAGMVPTTVIHYVIFNSEVVRGHWRSKEVKTGYNCKMQPVMQIFSIYTHMISPYRIVYIILTLYIIKGHWRSSGKVTEGQNRSKTAKNVKIHQGLQFFACIPIQYQ